MRKNSTKLLPEEYVQLITSVTVGIGGSVGWVGWVAMVVGAVVCVCIVERVVLSVPPKLLFAQADRSITVTKSRDSSLILIIINPP